MTSSVGANLAAGERPGLAGRLRRICADFWVQHAIWWADRCTPRLLRWFEPVALATAWRFSRYLRENLMANARYILGPGSTEAQRIALGRTIIARHYDFLRDFNRMRDWSIHQLQELIDDTEGVEHFRAARATRRGLIIVTAHIGSYEVGLAGIRMHEDRVHVVFKRNEHEPFERRRSDQRRRLGVMEAPVDDGVDMWLRLRGALENNEVVLIQGDRVMPGQRGIRVPFCGGELELPASPAKLAAASGAPIIPIFTVYTEAPRVRVIIEEPIVVAPTDGPYDIEPTVRRIGSRIEHIVRTYPDQWLAAHSALIGPPAQKAVRS